MSTRTLPKQGQRPLTKCLVATDVDQTILCQGNPQERELFLQKVAPLLARSAKLGVCLAFVTGNSMHEFCTRLLEPLIYYLCEIGRPDLLSQCHFFCNGAGVYAHCPAHDPVLRNLFAHSDPNRASQIFNAVVEQSEDKKLFIRPRFVDPAYIERSRIADSDVDHISAILEQAAREYLADLEANRPIYEEIYNLSQVSRSGRLETPRSDPRVVSCGSSEVQRATVQITLKPILSYRYAYHAPQIYGKDLRIMLTKTIQEELDNQGLDQYIARPGGRSSIDVTLEKVDKAYALSFLIDHLNLQGNPRHGQQYGSNTIYFGDEFLVEGGGNDNPILTISGVLCFAVTTAKDLVPSRSCIVVPSKTLEGPDATCKVLERFNKCVARSLQASVTGVSAKKSANTKTAIEVFEEELLADQIRDELSNLTRLGELSIDGWQVLHAVVDVLSHNEPAARQRFQLLVSEMDNLIARSETSYYGPNRIAA